MNNYASARIGILGAGGYTGRELARLAARHPRARIAWATSESDAGKPLGEVIPGVDGPALVRAEDAPLGAVDVVVSCLPHGDSALWMERARQAGARAIDLSADLRVPNAATPAWARGAVYGLPELHRARVAGAELVANPGCYPTAALLALAPLLRRGLVAGPVIVWPLTVPSQCIALSSARISSRLSPPATEIPGVKRAMSTAEQLITADAAAGVAVRPADAMMLATRTSRQIRVVRVAAEGKRGIERFGGGVEVEDEVGRDAARAAVWLSS